MNIRQICCVCLSIGKVDTNVMFFVFPHVCVFFVLSAFSSASVLRLFLWIDGTNYSCQHNSHKIHVVHGQVQAYNKIREMMSTIDHILEVYYECMYQIFKFL